MSKSKHETTGLTPEPASRKLRTDGTASGEKEEENAPDIPMTDPMTRLVIEELQVEMAGHTNETAYLMAQHADALRERAKREILVGGWRQSMQGCPVFTTKTGVSHTKQRVMLCRLSR